MSAGVPPPAPVTTSASNPFTGLNDLFGGPPLGASLLPGQSGYVAPKDVSLFLFFNGWKGVVSFLM